MKCKCCRHNNEFYVPIFAIEALTLVARMPEQYRKVRKDKICKDYIEKLNCQCYNVLQKLLFIDIKLDKQEESLYNAIIEQAKK